MTLPCPNGAKGAAGVRGRRCLPCGQRRCRVARRIWVCCGGKQGFGAFCPSGGFAGAPGTGATRVSPQGMEMHAIPRTERTLSPAKPSALSVRGKRGTLQAAPHHPRISRPQKISFPPFPSPPHPPTIPRGDRRALPAPAQGSGPLRIPFGEAASVFPSPRPPQPPSARTFAPSGTHRSTPVPCPWGGCASNPSQRHCLPAPPTRNLTCAPLYKRRLPAIIMVETP